MTEHIDLLSKTEITELYALPHFNEKERKLYFTIESEEESRALNLYSNFKTRVYFILQLGYFKAKHRFFDFVFEDIPADVEYILFHFVKSKEIALAGQPSRHSISEQKRTILQLLDYRDWSPLYQHSIELYISELLRYYPKSHSALRQLLSYFDRQQIVVPSYRTLQNLFTKAYAAEEKRINQLISSIPDHKQQLLSVLINREGNESPLNIIRGDQKDFNYTAVRTEIDKAESLADLYEFAKKFLPTLKLSKNAIRYCADIVEQYAAFRLRRLSKPQQFFHALCFIYHCYQKIMDNLITSFVYHTHMLLEAGKSYAEVKMMEHSAALVVEFPKLAQFLEWFPVRDKGLSHEELNQIAYSILPKEQFSALALFLKGNTFDKTASKWEFYLKSSRLFSLYLRPILLAIEFSHYKKNSKLMDLIHLLKSHYGRGKNPSQFKLADEFGITVPKRMRRYLKRKASDRFIDPYLFEFFVYQKVCHQIDRGFLCCNESISYCDIDQDLVDDALVNDVEKIAAELGYPKIPIYCDERLEDAIKQLDEAWDVTTENIHLGYNTGLKMEETKTGEMEWSLLYDSSEPLEDTFFKTLPQSELANVIMFMGERIPLWKSFTHLKDRYVKRKKPVTLALNGCLMSEAFGGGELKMAEMSDLNFNLLRSTREDFIRISTLCAANDRTSNYIHSLPR